MRRLATVLLFLVSACDSSGPMGPALSEPRPQSLAPEALVQPDREYVAVVTAERSQTLSLSQPVTIRNVLVSLGQKVKKGQRLIEVDDREIRRELEAAQGALESALAARSRASIEANEAGRQVSLAESLYRQKVRSREAVNEAEFSQKRARASVREFGGLVEQKEAEIAAIMERLNGKDVVADFDGIVSAIDIRPGSKVVPGQRLVRIVEPTRSLVRFAIPTEDIGKVKVGDMSVLLVDEREVPVRVESVAPDADPTLKFAVATAYAMEPEELARVPVGTEAIIKLVPSRG